MGENFMGGGGGVCSKDCERKRTCPPCMEAAPKLNTIFCSVQAAYCTHQNHTAYT